MNTEYIPGLSYHLEVITKDEEKNLIQLILRDGAPWMHAKGDRRVQQYGPVYDYEKRCVTAQKDAIPKEISSLAERLGLPCDQVIINEYIPGQGIAHHTDHYQFGPKIASLSLNSPANMVFAKDNTKVEITLQPRSLVILEGQARTKWTHSIPARQRDNGVQRGVRYSLTFRSVP